MTYHFHLPNSPALNKIILRDCSLAVFSRHCLLLFQHFRTFMNNVGELVRARELRLAIYYGGVEPQLRKVVWKHILGVYPSQLNGRERMDYMRQKSSEYEALKETWINLAAQGQVPDKVKLVTNMIRKDVLRTDRHHKFFASKKFISILPLIYNKPIR